MASGMAIAGGVIAVGGAVKNRRDIKAGASDQYAADQANIERMKLENAETIKRTEESQQQIEGAGRTVAAGTGFATGSSKDLYMDKLAKTHAEDLDWLKTSAESNIQLAGTDAANRYSAANRSASTALISGVGQGLTLGAAGVGSYQRNDGWWG